MGVEFLKFMWMRTVENNDQERDEERKVRAIRLQRADIRQIRGRNPLSLDRLTEANMRDQDGDPVEHRKDGHQAHKVAKDGGRGLARVHVPEADEEGCEADGVDGVAVGAGLGEEAWCLAVFGEAVQGARGAVDIYTEGILLVAEVGGGCLE